MYIPLSHHYIERLLHKSSCTQKPHLFCVITRFWITRCSPSGAISVLLEPHQKEQHSSPSPQFISLLVGFSHAKTLILPKFLTILPSLVHNHFSPFEKISAFHLFTKKHRLRNKEMSKVSIIVK